MLVQMLRLDGHEVATAAHGIEALKFLQGATPDVIITDILMPGMDGVETILELARRGSQIPIIAMSGGRRAITAQFNLESAALLGVAATLPKPFARATFSRPLQAMIVTRPMTASRGVISPPPLGGKQKSIPADPCCNHLRAG